jgi:hypothetical protein
MPHRAGPGDSYKHGGDCKIAWSADPTGKWTDMLIELKTGDNFAMVPLKGTNFSPCAQRRLNNSRQFYSDHHN